jgi:hypothetical protein
MESLRSYVDKLLEVHRTTRYQFDRFVWMHAGVAAPACQQHTFRCYDTPTPASLTFATCLADLTRQPTVARLGLGWLHSCMSANEALRGHVAWCEKCLFESSRGQRPVHLPLLWSLNCVHACPVHRRLLTAQCRSCGWIDRPAARMTFPYRNCRACGADLGAKAVVRARGTQPSRAQLVVADHVSDFLRDLPGLCDTDTLERPNCRAIADAAIERGICLSRTDFALSAGIMKNTFAPGLKRRVSSLNLWMTGGPHQSARRTARRKTHTPDLTPVQILENGSIDSLPKNAAARHSRLPVSSRRFVSIRRPTGRSQRLSKKLGFRITSSRSNATRRL